MHIKLVATINPTIIHNLNGLLVTWQMVTGLLPRDTTLVFLCSELINNECYSAAILRK